MLLPGPAKNGGGQEALEGHTYAGPGPRPRLGAEGKRRIPTHLEMAWAMWTGLGRFQGPGLTGNIGEQLGSIGTVGKRGIGAGSESGYRLNWTGLEDWELWGCVFYFRLIFLYYM